MLPSELESLLGAVQDMRECRLLERPSPPEIRYAIARQAHHYHLEIRSGQQPTLYSCTRMGGPQPCLTFDTMARMDGQAPPLPQHITEHPLTPLQEPAHALHCATTTIGGQARELYDEL